MASHAVASDGGAIIPGFGLTLGLTLTYLGLIVLIPLAVLFVQGERRGLGEDLDGAFLPAHARGFPRQLRHRAARRPVNAVFGFIVAWVLVRYRFPGRRSSMP